MHNIRKYAYNIEKELGSDDMLKDIRESKGLTRKELSELSGINFRSLQDYEQGHKNITSAKGETLYRLSVALGCSMEELVECNSVSWSNITDRTASESAKGHRGYLQAYSELLGKVLPWQEDVKILSADKELKVYYMMHRDEIVTTLAFDEVSGHIIRVGKKMNRELLPLGANLSSKDLKEWWSRRAVPLEQGDIRNLLQENRIPTAQSYLLQNLGLSLSDHYWVNPVDKFYNWEEVNLFTNDFRDELGNYSFYDSVSEGHKILNLKNRTVFYPSGSLQGELQKKWIVQNGKRYLIKANYGRTSQQSINEVIASLIHEKQNKVPYVKYQLCDVTVKKSRQIGCLCEDFCSKDIEFISAFDLVNSEKKNNDMSVYEHFIKVCAEHGLKEKDVRTFMEYQILTDFLISNMDRHLYNFGVLRDSRTLQFVGIAPVFDSGNSMFWNQKKIPEKQELLDLKVNSFLSREIELLKYVKNPEVIDVEKLPALEEIRKLLELGEENCERIEQILEAYKVKIDLLEQFQHGTMIYKYGYKI